MHHFLLFVIAAKLVLTVDTLVCLSCEHVTQPVHCKKMQQCDDSEVCKLEKIVYEGSEFGYRLGCGAPQACSSKKRSTVEVTHTNKHYKSGSTTVPVVCTRCCGTNFCNDVGCGAIGFPSLRGNLCLACDNIQTADHCTSLTICDQNEVCFLDEIVEYGDRFYSSGCRRKTECNVGNIVSPFGKRTNNFKKTHVCCNSDGCNQKSLPIRLVGGKYATEGRVEVFYNGKWGTVCDDYFYDKSAKVVCRSLNYPWLGSIAKRGAYFGYGSGDIMLDNVKCTGGELSILDCKHNAIGDQNCNHSEDIGVICFGIRLANGTSRRGRVEVFYGGQWGTVCDDSWGTEDAHVVCRMLGYRPRYPTALSGFGGGTGQIWMDNVNCTGSESSLIKCATYKNTFGAHDCSHAEDAGVDCG